MKLKKVNKRQVDSLTYIRKKKKKLVSKVLSNEKLGLGLSGKEHCVPLRTVKQGTEGYSEPQDK